MIVAASVSPGCEESAQPSGYYRDIGGRHMTDTNEHDCGGENTEETDQVMHACSLLRR